MVWQLEWLLFICWRRRYSRVKSKRVRQKAKVGIPKSLEAKHCILYSAIAIENLKNLSTLAYNIN